jgi:hypothetical protein
MWTGEVPDFYRAVRQLNAADDLKRCHIVARKPAATWSPA